MLKTRPGVGFEHKERQVTGEINKGACQCLGRAVSIGDRRMSGTRLRGAPQLALAQAGGGGVETGLVHDNQDNDQVYDSTRPSPPDFQHLAAQNELAPLFFFEKQHKRFSIVNVSLLVPGNGY